MVGVHLVKGADQTKKISVIKVIREVTGLGLAESKAVVDKAPFLRNQVSNLLEKSRNMSISSSGQGCMVLSHETGVQISVGIPRL